MTTMTAELEIGYTQKKDGTPEELMEISMRKPLVHACVKCGQCEPLRFHPKLDAELAEKKLCFDCHFWLEKLEMKEDPNVVRFNGKHYIMHNHKGLLDHGGRMFRVTLANGEVHETMLSGQGEIPDMYRAELPDNAISIETI